MWLDIGSLGSWHQRQSLLQSDGISTVKSRLRCKDVHKNFLTDTCQLWSKQAMLHLSSRHIKVSLEWSNIKKNGTVVTILQSAVFLSIYTVFFSAAKSIIKIQLNPSECDKHVQVTLTCLRTSILKNWQHSVAALSFMFKFYIIHHLTEQTDTTFLQTFRL